MATERGHEFEAVFNHGGVEIRSLRDTSISLAFMQGDEANALQDELESIGDMEFPRGPFADAESLIDVILGVYAYNG